MDCEGYHSRKIDTTAGARYAGASVGNALSLGLEERLSGMAPHKDSDYDATQSGSMAEICRSLRLVDHWGWRITQ